MNAEQTMKARISALSTGKLLEIEMSIRHMLTAEADVVSEFVLAELESRLPEADFIALCEAA